MEMELVVCRYMEKSLKMNRFGILILTKVFFRWPTLVQTQMDLNSSFATAPHPILTANTQCLEELFTDTPFVRRLSKLKKVLKTNL